MAVTFSLQVSAAPQMVTGMSQQDTLCTKQCQLPHRGSLVELLLPCGLSLAAPQRVTGRPGLPVQLSTCASCPTEGHW